MENHIGSLIIVGFTIIIGLIGVVYKNLINRIELEGKLSKEGLGLKVDSAEYKIVREWEKEVFSGMRLTIKELKDENNSAHEAIMLEIRKGK